MVPLLMNVQCTLVTSPTATIQSTDLCLEPSRPRGDFSMNGAPAGSFVGTQSPPTRFSGQLGTVA